MSILSMLYFNRIASLLTNLSIRIKIAMPIWLQYGEIYSYAVELEVGLSLGSSSRLELFFRLEVNKVKARARSSLKSQSSDELFCRLSKRLEGVKLDSIVRNCIFYCDYKLKIENFRLKIGSTFRLVRLDHLVEKARARCWKLGSSWKKSGSSHL